jgi:hypothetical protein
LWTARVGRQNAREPRHTTGTKRPVRDSICCPNLVKNRSSAVFPGLALNKLRIAPLQHHEAVRTFLKEHAAYICAECLASRLELPLPQTMMVTLGLQQVETTEDLCSLCHGRARVIRAKK